MDSTLFHIYCNNQFMKSIDFVLVIFFVSSIYSLQTQSPAWVINPNIDAGEVVAVNGSNPLAWLLSPTTIGPLSQHFNKTNFNATPNVILSMIGYSHSAPPFPTTPFGLRIVITGTNLLNFSYNITTYGCAVYDLHYLYLAVQYETSTYFMGIISQTFNASTNLGNSTATQRWQTFAYPNPSGWTNPNFNASNTQVVAFPIGYQIVGQSGWSYFGINGSALNSTHYSVNISTSSNNILNFLDFSIIMFNAGDIMANYSVYQDIMTTYLIGNSTTYVPPVITTSQYMFRNCLAGAVDITFNLASATPIGYYYGFSSANNDFLVWKTFNNRVRSCPSNLTYYNPSTVLCQDQCGPYYYVNTTYKLCFSCHYSCYNCSQQSSPTSCSTCSNLDNRSLVNNSCICNGGYYENAASVCGSCNYRCLTCNGGTSTSCLTCNSTLLRMFNNATNQCLCNIGYYENNTCLTCQSYSNGCTSCSYNVSTNNFNCSACNATLFRVLNSSNNKCVCMGGYYEDASFICQPCTIGCLSCSFNGGSSICNSCNSSLTRSLSTSNLTCDCMAGYYQNGNNTCVPCPVGCLICSFNSVNAICSSCDSSLNRLMGSGNLTCDCSIGYYSNSSSTCSICPTGCLSCTFNGTMPICLTCNSSLNRTMGSSNITCDCLPAYYLNSLLSCLPCPLACLTCAENSTQIICTSCNSSLNRVLSASNASCLCKNSFYENISQICANCQYGCLNCYLSGSNSVCTLCDSALLRVMGANNLTCGCQQGTYESANQTCLPCSTNCTSCTLNSSSVVCTACANGFFSNGSANCISCSVGCLSCSYDFSSSTQICLNCSSTSNFLLQNLTCVCISGTTLVGNTCNFASNSTNTTNTNNTNNASTNAASTNTTNSTTNPTSNICGNGILQTTESCDDGNTINLDGCSSTCSVQQQHTCINNASIYHVSLCYYSSKVQLTPNLIYKIPGKNSVKLQLKVKAPMCNSDYLKTYLEQTSFLALYDKTRLLLDENIYRNLQGSASWISIPAKTISYDPSTNILTIAFDYDATIDLTSKYIQFIPSTSTNSQGVKYFYASPATQMSLSQPYNHLSTTYYNSNDLEAVQSLKHIFLVLVILYWVFLIIALMRRKGVVGTECMLVLQITYFTLIDQAVLVEGWSGLQLTGRYTIGINPKILGEVNEPDLYALEIDSNLINVINITLILISILFLGIVGYRLYGFIQKKKRIKKLMEINETEDNNSIKNEKQIKMVDKIMVYVTDSLISFLFLTIGIFIIAMVFTNSQNSTYNMIEAIIMATISIITWVLYYRNKEQYVFSNISYLRIIINANKTSFHSIVKLFIQNYYIIVYAFLILAATLIPLLRKIGIAVYALIIVGCIGMIVFHSKFKIYFQILDSKRCIINSATLILLMIISLTSNILSTRLGTGLSIVIIVFCILFLLLVFNVFIFVILERKQLKSQKQQEIHEQEMKQMDNELALANISFIGGLQKGYNSINKSRDFTKDKDFINSLDFSSARKKMLLQDNQAKIFNMIEDKIKELKDFKKNMQVQLDSSKSQPNELHENSQNNATIENVLGALNFTSNDVEESGI